MSMDMMITYAIAPHERADDAGKDHPRGVRMVSNLDRMMTRLSTQKLEQARELLLKDGTGSEVLPKAYREVVETRQWTDRDGTVHKVGSDKASHRQGLPDHIVRTLVADVVSNVFVENHEQIVVLRCPHGTPMAMTGGMTSDEAPTEMYSQVRLLAELKLFDEPFAGHMIV